MKPHAMSLAAAALALSASSCNFNLFEPFDHPTSDAQLVSAARACFNAGDYACAQADYEKLSNNDADIKNSEEAFLALDQINAGMGAFIAAFGQSNISTGKALTSLANSIGANANPTNRAAVFAAYQKGTLVTDTSLKGLTRFVTSIALAAEMLAENASSPGNLLQTDIAAQPSVCEPLTGLSCGAAASCDSPSASKPLQSTLGGVNVPADLDDSHVPADIQGTKASLEVFNAAIATIQEALSQMGVSSTSANITGFTGALGSLAIGAGPPDSPCYREALLSQGVGQ